MKRRLLALLVTLVSLNAFAMDADFVGYLRGGTGLNLLGGKQECFDNQGIPGNFLRLGNECSFYSELAFVFNHKKPTETDSAFFRTQVRLEANAKGTRQWEAASNRDINQIEAFVTAGGISEIPGDIWVGKRFYRDVDLFIFDWYYYADMSGVGAGIENIKTNSGNFAFAHLIQTHETVTTDKGSPVLQALDLRWTKLPVAQDTYLNFWGVYAWAPKGSNGTTEYAQSNGFAVGSRLEGKLGDGYNNVALLYGKGAMQGFNIYGDSALLVTNEYKNKGWTVRLVENWNKDVTDRWAVMFGLAGEYNDSGADSDSRKFFYEVGVRPIYYVTDRIQMMMELGYSRIEDQSEKVGGEKVGERDLTRVTLAPQVSLSKSIWGRPVLRAYLTHSMWNKNNMAKVATNAPSFADKQEGTSFGYQFEAWF